MDHGDVMDQTETDVLGSVTQTEGHYDVRDQTETDIPVSVTQTDGGFTRSQKFATFQKLHIFATFSNNKRTTKR